MTSHLDRARSFPVKKFLTHVVVWTLVFVLLLTWMPALNSLIIVLSFVCVALCKSLIDSQFIDKYDENYVKLILTRRDRVRRYCLYLVPLIAIAFVSAFIMPWVTVAMIATLIVVQFLLGREIMFSNSVTYGWTFMAISFACAVGLFFALTHWILALVPLALMVNSQIRYMHARHHVYTPGSAITTRLLVIGSIMWAAAIVTLFWTIQLIETSYAPAAYWFMFSY